jgi:uncharacterized protein
MSPSSRRSRGRVARSPARPKKRSSKGPSKVSLATTTSRPRAPSGAKARKIPRIISIPDDVVLAPQTEAPRGFRGQDRSAQKGGIRELQWAEFDRLVQALARQISRTYEPDAVIGVAHGGVFVGGALASALATEFYPVRISRRSRDAEDGRPRLYGQIPKELKGKRLLIVDDVASSGDTLQLACALAAKVGARETRTAALVGRPRGFATDWLALNTEEFMVFPWDYEPVVQDSRFDGDPDKAGA